MPVLVSSLSDRDLSLPEAHADRGHRIPRVLTEASCDLVADRRRVHHRILGVPRPRVDGHQQPAERVADVAEIAIDTRG